MYTHVLSWFLLVENTSKGFFKSAYIKPWLHKIIIFDEIRKYYGKHKNDNHWVKLQNSLGKNAVLSRKHKHDNHWVNLQMIMLLAA